jgi:hypothetical protein
MRFLHPMFDPSALFDCVRSSVGWAKSPGTALRLSTGQSDFAHSVYFGDSRPRGQTRGTGCARGYAVRAFAHPTKRF